jgi:hypothetical protein
LVADPQPKVIFLAGYGRSGSTILDIALGQHPEVFGAGEITALTRHVWRENEYCACGARVELCPVWSEIVAQWRGGREDVLGRYRVLQRRFESLLGPMLIKSGLASSLGFAEYRALTEELFRAIVAVSGKTVVLDSSKLPGRAFALSRLGGIDLTVVHLVRDARAVAWSMTQSFERDVKAGFQKVIRPKSVMRTAVRWTMVNLMAEYASRQVAGRRARVLYEAFTADPEPVLSGLGNALGIDLRPTALAIARGEPISPSHQVAGSRIRMRKSMVLAPDTAWQAVMPPQAQARVRRGCGWMLRRYGYS